MSREATANINNQGIFGLAFCATLFAVCVSVQAQPAAKVSRIGFLVASSRPFYLSRIEAFRDAMVELGYTEGKNIVIEYRFANGNESLLNELANELVGLKLDLIVAAGSAAAAKNATKTIPIVFTAASDPVASGIVPNLAQPAGNITGLTILAPELTGKRLELLKEAFPKLSRVGLIHGSGVNSVLVWKEAERAAKALGLHLQSLRVSRSDDFDKAFETAKKDGAQAVITSTSPLVNAHRGRVLEFVANNRLPAIYASPEFADAGGLMYYGPAYAEMFRRTAVFVHKILNGAKPADIPVEQPTKFELVINLKTAKQIGLAIPQKVLGRADKVIK